MTDIIQNEFQNEWWEFWKDINVCLMVTDINLSFKRRDDISRDISAVRVRLVHPGRNLVSENLVRFLNFTPLNVFVPTASIITRPQLFNLL